MVDVDAELVEALRHEDADGVKRLVERDGGRAYRLALCITGVKQDAAHDVENISKPEISAILGADLPSVSRRVHCARLFLRQRLSEYFESPRAA